ncbi:MAG TPA: NAD-dependent epimerase/dehydratase family protein [Noviherbaspirillum sp.]|nr:NAD-dependent epimerase/dehydratase family protein [Noviherbaspirillum sp.]
MLKALVTGIEGFTGRFLAAELKQAGYEVFGLTYKQPTTENPDVKSVHVADLCDFAAVTRVVEKVKPDVVVHLAAIAFVAHGDVDAIYRTNLMGTRNLLEALSRARRPLHAVLLASSANVYGFGVSSILDETAAPAPANDYAVSKLAMEYMAKLYQDRMPLIIVRPFNYTGLGQSENFLLPKIISHVRRGAPVIELGNLDVARDFSDVRMVVKYYRLLLEKHTARGEIYNVCSGVPYSINDVLGMVRSLSRHQFEVRVNPAFVRSNEIKVLVGSRAKLEAAVGVVPTIPLIETLRWMLEAPVAGGGSDESLTAVTRQIAGATT